MDIISQTVILDKATYGGACERCVLCLCQSVCLAHVCVCGVGFVYICAWWENMLSLTPDET